MTHTVVMALLALSLNSAPFPESASRTSKRHSTPEKPRPSPPPPPHKPVDGEPRPPKPDPEHEDSPPAPEFSYDQVLSVIRSHELRIQDCYDRARSRSPKLQGEVIVEFDIDSDGRVRDEKATGNTTGDTELERCILQEVRSWRFRRRSSLFAEPFHVRHPFRFQTL